MKQLGLVLVVLGLLGGVFAFNLDTSVETGGETIGSGIYSVTIPKSRVNNLGLMEQRRNYLYASGLAILVGVILFGFGSLQQTAAASAPPPPAPAPKTPEQIAQDLAKRLVAGHKLQPEQITSLVEAATAENALAHTTSPVNGNTLLHMAAEANLLAESKKLVALGAKADTGNGNGKRPYQLATNEELSLFLKNATAAG